MNFEARSSKEGEQYNECDKKEMPEIIADEIQSAINKLNEGKACDNNGIRAERIKDCDDMTKEMMRHIFNEVIKRVALQKIGEEYESKLSTKKEAKKTPGTAAQFVLCQRCTNCSRQFSTTDYAPGLTRYNQKIKAGSVDPTKHWTT